MTVITSDSYIAVLNKLKDKNAHKRMNGIVAIKPDICVPFERS
jgi:hypothetical protein